jgi:hypothetical protein
LYEGRLDASAELFGRDTVGTGSRAYKTERQENIQNAEAANGAAKRGMEHDVNERRKMNEKKVLFPKGGPREIEEQSSHLEANDDQQCAKDAIHS